MTPTARTLKLARELGFEAGVVERYNSFTKQRYDLYGCIDLILMKPGVGIIGVQACAGSSHAARRSKIMAEPRMRTWIESGGRLEIWSFSKRGERGKRKTWTVRREEIK